MTIDDLKIEPKFRDLIPKLTDAEYKQLEENILADGRVKEPIIVWGNTIVDGHHRYYILKDHPEITDYKIEDGGFASEHDALAWACANQLGRRNLMPSDSSYLRATLYEERRLTHGGQAGNANAKLAKRTDENQQFVSKRTIDKVAKECGVSADTISRDSRFKRGIDTAEEILPGIKEEIMHGNTKIPKSVVEKIPKATPDKQRKAVIAISDGDVQKAKDILEGTKEALVRYGLDDSNKDVNYTIDDLINETIASLDSFINGLKTSIEARKDILDDDSKKHFTDVLEELFDTKIKEFMEGFLNE